jgi:hypothetical protein
MRTTIRSIILAAVVAGSVQTAAAQAYDYEYADTASIPKEKLYPAIMISPDKFTAVPERDVNGTVIPDRGGSSLPVDGNNSYYRMLERMQRLPGNESWPHRNNEWQYNGTRSKPK